jgi:hypothetical protein
MLSQNLRDRLLNVARFQRFCNSQPSNFSQKCTYIFIIENWTKCNIFTFNAYSNVTKKKITTKCKRTAAIFLFYFAQKVAETDLIYV